MMRNDEIERSFFWFFLGGGGGREMSSASPPIGINANLPVQIWFSLGIWTDKTEGRMEKPCGRKSQGQIVTPVGKL